MSKRVLVSLLCLVATCSYAEPQETSVTSLGSDFYKVDLGFGTVIRTRDCGYYGSGTHCYVDKSAMTITFPYEKRTCQIVGVYKEESFSVSPFFDRVDSWKSSSNFYALQDSGRIIEAGSGCWSGSGDVFIGSDGIVFLQNKTRCSINKIYNPSSF